MPRPRSLTRSGIAAAALAVVDRDGLAALTMRAVAKELGMAAMSLYRYVADRDELEVLVVDHVLTDLDLSVPPGPWRDRIAGLLERMRAATQAHREVVPLVVRHRHAAPASLRWIEATLAVLTEAGFTGRRRVVAQRTLVAYLLGALQNEHYGPLSGSGTAAMAELSISDFPVLAETAAQARALPPADEFRAGLAIVLDGLSAAASAR
ncbi:TetR/AcrR family transcriptional regulator [Actinophytocola gossypii]|uniref:TetR/AcrR family transcriptional regulator C-terminal domain-containing protein n=1 Tax=Actinophytocola gossypii TaxID=2812003 RepID=A0ABT2JB53_9PSEU|nr:TetR/AcrR family transcriptional regulator C-terminal domain-containing protein [Actinophytocola gossypii]MCT2584680.1 TetR/AcrR family transcriptional regulator C-terminal domain-containing protein [Actinophytocola gossypii]